MNFVNLTPHTINVQVAGINDAIPSTGNCRVVVKQVQKKTVKLHGENIPVMMNEYSSVIDLPEPKEDTVYIVSLMVLNALAGSRSDVLAPDSGPTAIRENGQIVAVIQFVCWS